MAEQKKQQVGSEKVNQLRPLDSGVNITVKVISKKPIAQRNRLAECLVGDETAIIILTARNDQAMQQVLYHIQKRRCFLGSSCPGIEEGWKKWETVLHKLKDLF